MKMTLFKEWEDMAYKVETQEEYDAFWNKYLEQEREIYKDILGSKTGVVEGSIKSLATKYSIEPVVFCGFIDGINSSLKSEQDMENLEEESEVKLEIDFEKLYFNMLEAKAPWLYELEEWGDILSAEKRDEITKEFRQSKIVRVEKIGRNEPCPCGSGKKYKKCCGK
jgi:preprotein translocase subunit SecA